MAAGLAGGLKLQTSRSERNRGSGETGGNRDQSRGLTPFQRKGSLRTLQSGSRGTGAYYDDEAGIGKTKAAGPARLRVGYSTANCNQYPALAAVGAQTFCSRKRTSVHNVRTEGLQSLCPGQR